MTRFVSTYKKSICYLSDAVEVQKNFIHSLNRDILNAWSPPGKTLVLGTGCFSPEWLFGWHQGLTVCWKHLTGKY